MRLPFFGKELFPHEMRKQFSHGVPPHGGIFVIREYFPPSCYTNLCEVVLCLEKNFYL